MRDTNNINTILAKSTIKDIAEIKNEYCPICKKKFEGLNMFKSNGIGYCLNCISLEYLTDISNELNSNTQISFKVSMKKGVLRKLSLEGKDIEEGYNEKLNAIENELKEKIKQLNIETAVKIMLESKNK